MVNLGKRDQSLAMFGILRAGHRSMKSASQTVGDPGWSCFPEALSQTHGPLLYT